MNDSERPPKSQHKKAIIALAALATLEVITIVFAFLLFPIIAGFDARTTKTVANFHFASSLDCTVVHSTHQKGYGISLPFHEDKTFKLTDLDTDTPKIEIPYREGKPSSLRKVFDDSAYITLQPSEQYWGTESIGISKTNGSFVRTITGTQLDLPRFHYAIAQKGYCE